MSFLFFSGLAQWVVPIDFQFLGRHHLDERIVYDGCLNRESQFVVRPGRRIKVFVHKGFSQTLFFSGYFLSVVVNGNKVGNIVMIASDKVLV